jgi:hypothetical protein
MWTNRQVSAAAILLFCVGFVLSLGTLDSQAPAIQPAPTVEQIADQRAALEKEALLGSLLNRASACEAAMLDLSKLKARVAQLEALEKRPEPKNDAKPAPPMKPEEPVKPKD